MTRDQFIRDLTSGSAEMGVPLDAKARERLYLFYGELRKWNRSVNLVSRKEPDWVKVHFLDSLAPLSLGLIRGSERMVDLGAGAGFPSVPIKVVFPGMRLGMVEASGKKCAWLRHVVRLLELEDVDVFEGRFDELAGKTETCNFDLAVSRAAARPPKIADRAGGFLAPGGRLLVYTKQDLVVKETGNVYPYRVPGSKMPCVIWEVTY